MTGRHRRPGKDNVGINAYDAERRLAILARRAAWHVQTSRMGVVPEQLGIEIAELKAKLAAWRAGEPDATI